jgi:hypothetical protein
MANKFKFSWDKVTESIKEGDKKKGFQKDERFWKPTLDDKGNATAIIRFIPDPEGTPFEKYYTHSFNYMVDGVKKWWIRNCLNTFGYDKECPICKKNQIYWDSAFESDKAIASQRKRKLTFVSNILVIKNPGKPEDEGKVFLYNFGQKIYDKIKDKMFPSDEIKALGEYDEYVPFDLYEGANFKLVQVKQGDFPNYDKSEFFKQTAVGNDDKIEAIMEKSTLLSEFMADDKFPTNEEVVTKLGALLGLTQSESKPEAQNLLTEDEPLDDISTSEPLVDDDTPPFDIEPDPVVAASSDDDDEDFFKNLK